MKNILLILVIVLVSNTFGKVSTDSLEALLPGLEDSKQVKIFNELAFELCRISPEKSISYANQALELARKYQNKEQEAEALINIANIYRGSGEFDKALEYLQQAFSLSENIQYQKGMARSLTSFGVIYDYQGDYDKALENYFKALALCEKMDDKEGIGGTLMGIGIIYWYLNDNNKALDYYLQAEKAYEEGSFDHGLAAIANNIGLIYMGQEKYEKALEYYKKALSIHKKTGQVRGIAEATSNMGVAYSKMGNYDLALSYYKRSQKMYEKIGYKWGVTDMELDIGNILLKQKKYGQALNNLEKGLKLATEINAKDQMKYGFGKLSELYAEQNNYKKALDNYILYSEVKDSIYTESKSRIIAEMDTKYETAKKEKEIELLSKNNAIHQLEIKRQRSLRNSFIIITILIFVLLAVLHNRYRVKSKANRDLENAMKVLKETQQQLVIKEKMASLGNLVAGVAHEINNPISAVKCASGTSDRSLENIIELLENNPEFSRLRTDNKFDKALHILKTNCKIISDGSGRVEKIVKSLENFVYLDKSESQKFDVHKGIEDTLTILHHTLGNRIVIEKEYSALPEIHCFPSRLNQVFMNLFTNAIQAINNNGIIKIKTSRKDDNVVIEISDNGQGIEKNHIDKIFDPGFTTKSRGVGTGLGLAIVYQIIEKHKGKINVSSKKGEGTSFEILLPINT